MLYEIMASLRFYLTSELPQLSKVQFMYDGVSLTGLQKPFATIESLAEPTSFVAMGRASLRESYVFQVGVFASDFTGGIQLQGAVKEALQKAVPFYDGTLKITDKTFVCDISDFTPIRNSDIANDTFDYHGYFDVSVTIYRDVGSKEFTQ